MPPRRAECHGEAVTLRESRRRVLAALVLTAALVGDPAAAQSLEPLEVDWQQVFRLSWEVGERYRKPRIVGKIDNVSFYGTSQIQLLVEQLDASGRTVAQQVVWLGFRIAPGDSAYFDVPLTERSAGYRVRVYAFDRKFGTAGS
jgi:hypothetical protein